MKKTTFLCLFLSSGVMAENSDLTGKLVNENNTGLNQAIIKIKHGDGQAVTSSDGSFVIPSVPEGTLELDIEISNSQHFHTKINHDGQSVVINLAAMSLDEMVVSSMPLEHNTLEMTTPVAIINEDELVLSRGTSIDQTLNGIPGVHSGSFGIGAGQIVIRGQQGPRVAVLNNNHTLQDASRVSPDHWVTTEPMLAQQVEVLKGPATLLYGGGAIGGVVNVIDGVIPTRRIAGIEGAVEGRLSDDALNERAAVLSLDAGLSPNLMAHFSYFNTQTNDYEIPGFAESRILHEAEGHDDHDHDDDDGGEEEAFGILENSSTDSDGTQLGLSWVTDRGHWGVSFRDFNRSYGLPGHSHEHHDEDHDDDHGDDHGDHDDDHDHEEVHHEEVRLILDKRVLAFEGVHAFSGGGMINQFKTHYTDTDYSHVEFEGGENGTVFDNQASEFRFELTHHEWAGFKGIMGFQHSQRDFSAIGEEAFILPSTTDSWSVFLIEERDFEHWHAEFGLRYEDQNVETALFNDIDDQALSVSLGANFQINDHWSLPINVSSAQRLPTAEELFSNQGDAPELIPHLATSLIEIGDINLEQETAINLDIGLKYRSEHVRFNFAWFYNQIDDFIFLRDSGTSFEDTPIFDYAQQNSTFTGFEADVEYLLDVGNSQWGLQLFADTIDAELNTGDSVPRIPSDRFGMRIQWSHGPWSAGLKHTHVMKQNDVAALELPTNGYDLLNFNINWLHQGSRCETLLFLQGSNLLNEEVRDHASFIKDVAPKPGRSITAGFRLMF